MSRSIVDMQRLINHGKALERKRILRTLENTEIEFFKIEENDNDIASEVLTYFFDIFYRKLNKKREGETQLKIIQLLKGKCLGSGDLAKILGLSVSTVTEHLQKMQARGTVVHFGARKKTHAAYGLAADNWFDATKK